MTRDKIIERLNIQEEIEGPSENLEILRFFLSVIQYSSQWEAFVNVKHHRYGTHSYQTHQFYYPTDALLAIYNKDPKS